ncbi:MinD/ParA family ATP-binding protein [Nocardia gamkensis]|uniref:MinD/ParA family ATP-binding protein n=1 Tax=Nocardia gamkensis TaxID=352869 RepID=UPI000AA4A49F|nr:MinD/ParA family protein [Nocardia gamkensis]NQE67226.1 Leucine-rich repeat extensin-like protein 5 [Nocardia gamkensis]
MSRSNDGLPMLPPWLSESEVGQSGYEAPVQNLPHEDLIEETPGRRRGRFKNRAPEADRPDAARPEKRRKGWRRDKHEGAADEEQRQSEASRAPAPVPDEPVPAQLPPESWQHPGYDRTPPAQDNSWQAPPQPHQRDNTPQHSLPTRNPSQPSPGFQPLGSRAANPAGSNDQQTHRQSERPDLPPLPRQSADEQPGRTPNDEPVSPSRGESAQVTGGGRPPLGPQNGGWPSTGNPRLDAALAAVRPSQWPTSPPPGQAAAPVAPAEPAHPGSEPREIPPTGNQPTSPTGGNPSAPPPQGGYPFAPDPATWQSGYSPTPTSAQPTPPHGEYPAAPPSAPNPATWQHGHPPTPTSAQPTPPPPIGDPTPPPTGDSTAEQAGGDSSAALPNSSAPPVEHPTTSAGGPTPGASDTTPPIDAHQALPADRPAPPPQAAQAEPTAVTPDGPPPWLAAPQPAQTEASAPDTPRRLPPLPDPPAPHERPHSGGSGTPATAPAHDEHRPTRGTDGPPPWLGHTASEQTGRPSRPGLPPAPNETAAQTDSATHEPHLPAYSSPASHQGSADNGATEPFLAPSATVPHAGQGGAVPVSPAPLSAAAIGAAPVSAPAPGTDAQPAPADWVHTTRAQGEPGASAPGWTSATETGPASMRPVAGGGRHRLSAESNDPTAAQAPVEQAPNVDQQPVPQQQDTAYHAGGPHAASGVYAGPPTPFASGQVPGLPPQTPAAQWGNAAAPAPAPESGPVGPHSAPPQYHPEHQAAGQPVPQPGQWGTPPGYPQPHAQPPGAPFQQPSLDNVPLRRAKKAPGSGWRKAVHHVSGGSINPGMSAEERRLQELVARIRQPVRGDYRIAVLSLKGGVGKTTTTMGIGSIFASIRGDRVIAVDANPDFGTLSQRVPLQTRSTVRDLLLDSSIQRYSDVRRHTSQATSRLEVLASERDPAASEAFSEDEYRAVARILQRFYNIILTDCGTGLMHSAMAGVLDLAHSLVLISSPAIDGARSAAATLDWLSLHGHDHLVRNAVVVINSPRAGSPNVGIQQLREYFLSRCRAVHIIPFDPHMSEGAEIDLHRLHKQTKRAYVELAATVADDFATDHRRYQP